MKYDSDKIAKTFEEWDYRWRTNPTDFQSVVDLLLRETPYSYGKSAGAYFEWLYKELFND